MDYIRQYSHLTPQELRQLKYKRQYKAENPSWDDSMVLLTNAVRERIANKPRVLDFGCGRGNFVVDELGDVFSEKVGLDASLEATTGNTSMNRVVIGDDDHLAFADQSFDVVLSLWVFEHVEHPHHVFQEIHRVLKPGGFFAFVTPNRKSLLITLRRYLSKQFADRLLKKLYGREEEDVFDVFYRANTTDDIQALANQTGFTIELLQENADPSYTAFNAFTYQCSTWFTKLLGPLARPHIIAVLKKP
jgi:SAM-dependent methyltransferase